VAPADAAVGRAAGEHRDAADRVVADRQRRHHPHAVLGGEGDRRVADAVVRTPGPRLHRGDPWQDARGPGRAAVGGRGEPDGAGAAVEEAAGLERRDDGVPERVGVRFDLRPVLARRVGSVVRADLGEGDVGGGGGGRGARPRGGGGCGGGGGGGAGPRRGGGGGGGGEPCRQTGMCDEPHEALLRAAGGHL